MNGIDVLNDALSRIGDGARSVVEGLTGEQLNARIDGRSNSITWLVWHAARVQDAQVAAAFEVEQVWFTNGWAERFGLPLDAADTGYGHSSDEVARVRVEDGALLTGYLDDALAQSARVLGGVKDADLDRVVDKRWDPPVTLGVRLVSVVDDDAQHLGQAAFLRGLLEAR
ncbi:mycothiol transferase [Angustibacter sp. McL0619]|uniref:mycothiol transferase n=1 Tax=Angustibacter sp. McL0619 TaxID=3415676 RepID=UPI003CF07A55